MKEITIDMVSVLDAWGADADIESYRLVEDDNALHVVYYLGDDRVEDTIPAEEIAEWFDASFVRWNGARGNPTALVVTRDNGENN